MSGKAKAWTSVKQQNNKDADSIYQAPPVPQDNSIGNSMGSTIEMVLALAACETVACQGPLVLSADSLEQLPVPHSRSGGSL